MHDFLKSFPFFMRRSAMMRARNTRSYISYAQKGKKFSSRLPLPRHFRIDEKLLKCRYFDIIVSSLQSEELQAFSREAIATLPCALARFAAHCSNRHTAPPCRMVRPLSRRAVSVAQNAAKSDEQRVWFFRKTRQMLLPENQNNTHQRRSAP